MEFIKEKYVELDVLKTQKYIHLIKETFAKELSKSLSLTKVAAPIVVTAESGLQDDLSGTERKVAFDLKKDGSEVEIVQSLAKWKRFALQKYSIETHKGLYTDMTALRRDDKIDQTHSIHVEQWDWEKVITKKDRTVDYLKQTVQKIVTAIKKTADKLSLKSGIKFPEITEKCHFITAQELLDLYPTKTAKEREDLIAKQYKTVFVIGIGDKLTDGKPHDLRAPDYDDWSLDGDLFFYDEVLGKALELSSMGIRVDADAMLRQLEISQQTKRLQLKYHRDIVAKKLPLSIGGGIGQSRLCMLLLGKAHIGQVQASYWDKQTLLDCEKQKIALL